jgi:hypothetical protein
MKKVMFLMAVAGMFAFAACNNNAKPAEEAPVEEAVENVEVAAEETAQDAVEATEEAVENAAEEATEVVAQ